MLDKPIYFIRTIWKSPKHVKYTQKHYSQKCIKIRNVFPPAFIYHSHFQPQSTLSSGLNPNTKRLIETLPFSFNHNTLNARQDINGHFDYLLCFVCKLLFCYHLNHHTVTCLASSRIILYCIILLKIPLKNAVLELILAPTKLMKIQGRKYVPISDAVDHFL